MTEAMMAAVGTVGPRHDLHAERRHPCGAPHTLWPFFATFWLPSRT